MAIVSYTEKLQLFRQCAPILSAFFKQRSKTIPSNALNHFVDGVDALDNMEGVTQFDYCDVFFVLFASAPYFLSLRNLVKQGELDLSPITTPDYWDNNTPSVQIAIFFSNTFLNEIYKDEIAKDFKKLEHLATVEDYRVFRDTMLNKQFL
jgi:hypothetical protein